MVHQVTFLATTGLSAAFVGAGGSIVTAVVLLALKWVVATLKQNLEEGRTETTALLTQIHTETRATNGRVTGLEHEVGVIKERLAFVEGGTDAAVKLVDAVLKGVPRP